MARYLAHDILLCIKQGEFKSTPIGRGRGKRFGYQNAEYYFKSQEEMKELFKDIPESILNIQEIVDKVEDFDLERDVVLPKFSVPKEFYDENDIKESQIELIEDGLMRELERSFLLQKIDSSWKDHLQNMNALRETIAWRGYGQKDPLIEYKNEAYVLFISMVTNIRHSVTYLIFRSQPILKV